MEMLLFGPIFGKVWQSLRMLAKDCLVDGAMTVDAVGFQLRCCFNYIGFQIRRDIDILIHVSSLKRDLYIEVHKIYQASFFNIQYLNIH